MKTKDGTEKNMILHLLEVQRAMRECIQKGGTGKDMQKVAESYGFTLATPI
jgi:hypothetical protein